MSNSNAFAYKNSGLGAFLFAEVGTELNGSDLTVLSMLARLGLDPWAEAAQLVDLPKKTVLDRLIHNITRMPLSPRALADAAATAARLTLLLPLQNTAALKPETASRSLGAIPAWLPMTLLYCALALGMGLNMIMSSRSTTATMAPSEPAALQAQ